MICPHCGHEFSKNFSLHEPVCPRNPDQAARLRAFMLHWAKDGYGMSRAMYVEFLPEYKAEHGVPLPAPVQIQHAYGTWQAFVAACGLSYEPRNYHPPRSQLGLDPVKMPGSVMADDTEHHDPSCLRCEPVERPVRAWQPHSKTWAVTAIQTAWQVR